MANFATDSAVEGGDGHYRLMPHPAWEVWGPSGGYRPAGGMRASAAERRLPRPASFCCNCLGSAVSAPAEIVVQRLPAGKRAESFQATMTQNGRPVMSASAWVVADGLQGFEHDVAVMPDVPGPGALR